MGRLRDVTIREAIVASGKGWHDLTDPGLTYADRFQQLIDRDDYTLSQRLIFRQAKRRCEALGYCSEKLTIADRISSKIDSFFDYIEPFLGQELTKETLPKLWRSLKEKFNR